MTSNNISIVLENKKKCFGCGSCFNICHTNAITMAADDEGFLYPKVNESKCKISCQLCQTVCPALGETKQQSISLAPSCYAVMSKDEIRLKSSTGGAFFVIASWFLEQKAYVCGAAFTKDWSVEHIIITQKEDLYKLCGVKYIQSSIHKIYSEIKHLLTNGEKVLFTGTPCQIAGLQAFLLQDYTNLYTIDFMCHGISSPAVWQQYLQEEHNIDEIIDIQFRKKVIKAGTIFLYIENIKDGNFAKKNGSELYLKNAQDDSFYSTILSNMCSRPACEECNYTTDNIVSDIRLADYWANKKVYKSLENNKFNDFKGVSLFWVNSKKGQNIYNNIQKEFIFQLKAPFNYSEYNSLTTCDTPNYNKRNMFFRLLKDQHSVKESVEYCLKNQYDCAIAGAWVHGNYGSFVTTYALQEAIKALGYSIKVINKIQLPQTISTEVFNNRDVSYAFSDRYFDLTEEISTESELLKLNRQTSVFITGGDCPWYPPFFVHNSKTAAYFFQFCDNNKKKISYSSGFGSYNYNYNHDYQTLQEIKYFLHNYDYLSSREFNGIKLCKDVYDLEIQSHIESVFLIDKSYYEAIAESSLLKNKDFITAYIFHETFDVADSIDFIKEQLGIKVTMRIYDCKPRVGGVSVVDWLYAIKESKMVITHSFHGLCMAIIFNIPFICYRVIEWDDSRYSTILSRLGLENRLIKNLSDVKTRPDLFEPIDWNKVNTAIEKERNISLKWLKNAIETPKDLSKIKYEDFIIQSLKNRLTALEEQYMQKT